MVVSESGALDFEEFCTIIIEGTGHMIVRVIYKTCDFYGRLTIMKPI